MSELFHGGIKIINQINQAGFEAFFVGGCVRDQLLGRAIHDIDITTNATPEQIAEIFQVTIPVGIQHGTMMVKMDRAYYEVSTYKSSEHETPTILTDLAHRDFTINAMALTKDFQLIDPYNFQTDVNEKRIRAVFDPDKRFSEDPLRMLRAIRFVSQLGFVIEEQTKSAISKYCEKFSQVAKERIVQEFEKLLLGNFVKKALSELIETNLFTQISFLEDKKLIKSFCQMPIENLMTVEERWALLFYCRESKSVPPIYMSKQQKKEIKTIVENLEQISNNGWQAFTIYEVGLDVAKKICRILHGLNKKNSLPETEIERIYKQIPIKNRHDLAVTGKDLIDLLEKRPGPWLKSLLERIEQHVVDGKINNNKEEIFAFAQKIIKEEGV